ncbi:MAG: tRNA (adenosine(37)-N6)-threonylcarbamoyltransferase complex dimerization subunit type 1 TsaB [Bacteroidia bacterium]|nr:tRNA (adenosine(37)-N6)-threonylcarbamoyltransferase complex dimerization subunit type 1 TsaB [Bacteroidia bacterium]
MPLILSLETATTNCSVALASDGKVVASRSINSGYSHSEKINVFIQEVIAQAGVTLKDLQAVAVSSGPGSYTGLRIGISTAKGLCYALDIPLIAVNTLDAMAQGFNAGKDELIVPMIDARRMEVYSAVYDSEKKRVSEIEAIVVDDQYYSNFRSEKKLVLAGDGADKCQALFQNESSIIIQTSFVPQAEFMAELAEQKFQNSDIENVALFEPFYLKEFVAGPKRASS